MCFNSNLFFLLILCLSLQCSVAYLNGLRITNGWVQWILIRWVKSASYWFCGLSLSFSIAYFNVLWITTKWVKWICINLHVFSFCALLFPLSIAYFNALWITSVWVQWILIFMPCSCSDLSLSCSLSYFNPPWVTKCINFLLLMSMHLGFLGGEFTGFFSSIY